MKKILLSIFCCMLAVIGLQAQSYVKVTTAPADWEGDYLIVYETNSVAFNGGLSTLDAISNTIAVTIDDNEIAATDATNAAKFTIEAVSGGYAIKSASGNYIGVSSNSNGLKQTTTSTTYKHSLSIDASANAVINAVFEKSTMALRFNKASNQNRFRYYKNAGQEAIQLYKYTEGTGGGDEVIVAQPTFNPAAGAVTKGTKVELSCETADATIYYAIGEGAYLKYVGTAIVVNEETTINAYAKLGDAQSATVSATYTIAKLAVPTFTPQGGMVAAGKEVTISHADDGATIKYSINGGEYKDYTDAIIVNEAVTITAYATKEGYDDSDEVTAEYTILPEGTSVGTIVFKTSSSDSSTAATTTNFVSGQVASSDFEGLSCTATDKCYTGISGLKMSTSSTDGSFSLDLGEALYVTQIVVNAVRYKNDSAAMSVNGSGSQTLTATAADYTFDINSEISTIIVDMTERGYIASITVNYVTASTPDPVTPTITADACDMGEVLVGEKATKALADIERVVENFSGDVVYTYVLAENDNFAIDGENLVFTAPAVAGVHEATLTITATYGEEVASVDVTVKATVLAPTITATDYDFGIVTVEKSKAISLSLLNVEVSNFSGEVEYTYELTASEYFTIEAVEGKTGNIVFNAPAEAGDYGTVLNITATCGVQTATTAINISGTAYAPITTPTGSGYVALTSVSEIDENKEYYMAAYFTATEKDDEGNIISETPMYAIINGVKEATDGYRFSTENSTELKVVDGTPTFAIKKSGDYYTIYDTKNGHYIYLDDEVDKNKLGMSSTISSPWSITYNDVAFEIGNVANNETNVGGGLAFNDQANYISWYTVIANEDYSYNIVLYTEGTAVVTDPYDGEQLGASKEEINRTNCITVTYEEGCEIANVDYSKITITQGNKSGVIVDQKEEEEATQAPRKAAAEAVVFATEAAETDNASNNTFAFRPTYLMTVQDENGVDKEVEFNTLPAGYKYTIAMEAGAVTFADDTQSSAYSWSFDMAIGTGVEDVTVAGALAYNGREVVAADSAAMIEVYNMSGVLVAAERGRANLNGLAGGVYVVRCGNDVLKVVR